MVAEIRLEQKDSVKVDLLRYSIQLAMLKQLFSKSLLTEKEYNNIKAQLMKDYKISSNIIGFL